MLINFLQSEIFINEVVPFMHKQILGKKSIFYGPNEALDTIFILQKGEVILFDEASDNRNIFDVLEPGAIFGNFHSAPKVPNHYAKTTKRSILLKAPSRKFLEYVSTKPELLEYVISVLAFRLDDYTNKIQTDFRMAFERIYSELKRLQLKKRSLVNGKLVLLPLQITHERIGELTHLNRVTVTRCMDRLTKKGLISVDDKRVIHIKDVESDQEHINNLEI